MGSDKSKTRRHGDGLFSRWRERRECWVYTLQYYWRPWSEELAEIAGAKIVKGKIQSVRVNETVPEDYCPETGRLETRKPPTSAWEAAKAMRADRHKQRFESDWVPPKFQAIIDAREAEAEAARLRAEAEAEKDRRAPLLFEAARDRFMAEEAGDYADGGKAAGYAFDRLGIFFAGKMLDEITRADYRQFFKERATKTGAFLNDPRPRRKGARPLKASTRAAEVDGSQLGALYTFLQDTGYERLENPVHRPRTRKKDSPLAPYRPKRKKVTPNPAQLEAIFTATKDSKPGGNGAKRPLISAKHRVLWMLCYFTGARPESEPCRLRHGDVEFLKDGWALVSYTDAKNTISNRTIPVPPEVAEPLRAIMEEPPSRFEKDAHTAWRERYIFTRQRRVGTPWLVHSYLDVWDSVLSVVAGIDGMIPRDLRSTAKKWMRKSNVSRPVEYALMGHKQSVHDEYDDVDLADLRVAVEKLRLPNIRRVQQELDEAASQN